MLALLITLIGVLPLTSPVDSVRSVSGANGALSAHPAPKGSSIEVDGSLQESAWSDLPVATEFRQLKPKEGAEPSQDTGVRVIYGTDAIYVGAYLYDDRPERIRDRLTRRDQQNQADWFEVSIDAYYDQKTARTFAVNAAGVQRDGVVEGGGHLDSSWDGVWYSDVRITEEGWIAELRIPYSMLRFSEMSCQTWGIQFRRRIPRNSEVVEWPLVPESERQSGVVAEYARLTDLRNLNADRNLQVAPYTLARAHTQEQSSHPGTRQASASYDVGADLEVGLGSSSTLTATVNPDFGQVESDPAVLNLSAFETYFPEKRPFFVQGSDVFSFEMGQRLLYTRRIGAEAPVVGAAKITGRSQGGLVYGAMAAMTGPKFTPTRTYVAGRLRQDLGVQSTIGGMVTAYDGPLSSGRRRSLAGGLDWDLRFFDQSFQFDGYASTTHRSTTSSGSPVTGHALKSEIGRVQGDWTYDLGIRLRTDTFNPNDVGRLRRNNFFRTSGDVQHQFNGGQPVGRFQQASASLFVGHSWGYTNRLSRGLGFYSSVDALTDGFRPVSLSVHGDMLFGGYDLFETRGLWPRARPRIYGADISVGTDSRRSWTLDLGLGAGGRSDGGTSVSSSLDAVWNVSNRLTLSGTVSYRRERNAVEWASNETFVRQSSNQWAIGRQSGPPSDLSGENLEPLEHGSTRLATILGDVRPKTDEDSYYVPVYGDRDTDRLSATVRSNLTLTRTLSLEVFGQLFGARGRYSNFQILSSRSEFDPFSSYPKRHDFARSRFVSNTVLRWEFQPGSELFMVWSQDRSLSRNGPVFANPGAPSPYRPSTPERLTDALQDFAENTFILKLRYLIS